MEDKERLSHVEETVRSHDITIARLDTILERLDKTVGCLEKTVKRLEMKPASKYETIADKILWLIIAGGLGAAGTYIISKLI